MDPGDRCLPTKSSNNTIFVPVFFSALEGLNLGSTLHCGPITLLAGSAQFPKAIGLLDVTNQVLTLHIVSAKKQKEIRNLLRKRPGPQKKEESARSFNFHFTWFKSGFCVFGKGCFSEFCSNIFSASISQGCLVSNCELIEIFLSKTGYCRLPCLLEDR